MHRVSSACNNTSHSKESVTRRDTSEMPDCGTPVSIAAKIRYVDFASEGSPIIAGKRGGVPETPLI
jgi:hypothetical protein